MFRIETGHAAVTMVPSTTPIRKLSFYLLPLLVSVLPFNSFANAGLESYAKNSSSYYEIREQLRSPHSQPQISMSPVNLLSVNEMTELETELLNLKNSFFSLLDWEQHAGNIEAPAERYNRRRQFGTWKTNPDDESCLDVRGLILQRDSEVRVATRQSRDRCVVVSGRWVDPYNGQTYTAAADIDIDHVVPLKNAYDNGGWRWSSEKRCRYFNFTESKGHLLPVSQRENASKSDSSPADYLPPMRSAQCGYLKNWLSIKLTWGLTLPAYEAESIREHVHQLGCDQNDFVILKTDLEQIRHDLEQTPRMCDESFVPVNLDETPST